MDIHEEADANMNRIRLPISLAIATLLLTGCVDNASVSSSSTQSAATATGFGLAIDNASSGAEPASVYEGFRPDVIVPVFDPNIPEDSDDYEEKGIWPEVRRTEAIRFARSLRQELVNTNAFGNVWLSPDKAVAGELFVLGKIEKSNGEDIELEIQVYDISGRRWMKKDYSHRVKEYHWQSSRTSGTDPYAPVFVNVAKDVVKLLKKKKQEDLAKLRAISEIQFASVFVGSAFDDHVELKDRKITLISQPAHDDPMLERTRALRVVDGLFMDKMQGQYDSFVQKTDDSYKAWQEHSMVAAKDARIAKQEAQSKAVLGSLLLIGAALAGSNNDSDDTGVAVASAAAAVGGVVMLQQSFSARADGKYHQQTLTELGKDLNIHVEPQVVELEDSTVTLQGDVHQQFQQWRGVLIEIYNQEKTPNVQL